LTLPDGRVGQRLDDLHRVQQLILQAFFRRFEEKAAFS